MISSHTTQAIICATGIAAGSILSNVLPTKYLLAIGIGTGAVYLGALWLNSKKTSVLSIPQQQADINTVLLTKTVAATPLGTTITPTLPEKKTVELNPGLTSLHKPLDEKSGKEVERSLALKDCILPQDIIHSIGNFLTGQSLLTLASTYRELFKNRFNLFTDLQHIEMKNTARIQEFLGYYHHLQSQEISSCAIRHPNDFHAIQKLTITLSGSLTTNDINDLITALPHLTTLNIVLDQTTEYTHLQTVLTEIQKLSRLTDITLSSPSGSSSITQLPTELAQLTQLQTLRLVDLNDLTALPAEIGNLAQLQTLELNWLPNLTALPPEIEKLSQLQTLKLKGLWKLTALPTKIGNLIQLQTLILNTLDLTALPPEIGQLSQLQKLTLARLDLTDLPPEIGNLAQLQTLKLRGLKLTTLPSEIGLLTNLETLYLSNNNDLTLPDGLTQQLPNCKILFY